jgi:hypothetical protein
MSWDEGRQTCSNVASGVNIDILTAAVGSLAEPQQKVQYARLEPVYSSWKYPSVGAANDMAFAVTIGVRFVAQAQSSQDIVRSLPPLDTFPADIFYPFTE